MTKIIGIANSCKDCPERHYYSGGAYECLKVRGSRLNADSSIPAWCPLPDHPADAIESLQRDNAALMEDAAAQVQIARDAVERAAGLERDAARYRWLRRQAISARYYASGDPNWEIDWALRGESFEAAVDAAMKTTESA